jgi:hypothetical protein
LRGFAAGRQQALQGGAEPEEVIDAFVGLGEMTQ